MVSFMSRCQGEWGSQKLPLTIGEFMTTYQPTMIHHTMIFEEGP